MFSSAKRSEAIEFLVRCLRSREKLVAVTGPAGAGKSAVVRAALEQYEGPQTLVIRLDELAASAAQTQRQIACALDLPNSAAASAVAIAEAFSQRFQSPSEVGPVTVVVDPADNWPPATLHYLGLLQELACRVRTTLQIVLVGSTEFWALINEREFERLRDAVTEHLVLYPTPPGAALQSEGFAAGSETAKTSWPGPRIPAPRSRLPLAPPTAGAVRLGVGLAGLVVAVGIWQFAVGRAHPDQGLRTLAVQSPPLEAPVVSASQPIPPEQAAAAPAPLPTAAPPIASLAVAAQAAEIPASQPIPPEQAAAAPAPPPTAAPPIASLAVAAQAAEIPASQPIPPEQASAAPAPPPTAAPPIASLAVAAQAAEIPASQPIPPEQAAAAPAPPPTAAPPIASLAVAAQAAEIPASQPIPPEQAAAAPAPPPTAAPPIASPAVAAQAAEIPASQPIPPEQAAAAPAPPPTAAPPIASPAVAAQAAEIPASQPIPPEQAAAAPSLPPTPALSIGAITTAPAATPATETAPAPTPAASAQTSINAEVQPEPAPLPIMKVPPAKALRVEPVFSLTATEAGARRAVVAAWDTAQEIARSVAGQTEAAERLVAGWFPRPSFSAAVVSLPRPVAATPKVTPAILVMPDTPLPRLIVRMSRADPQADRIVQAFRRAGLPVTETKPSGRAGQRPGVGYFFVQDHDRARAVGRVLAALAIEAPVQALPMPAQLPPPGTVEVVVPNR